LPDVADSAEALNEAESLRALAYGGVARKTKKPPETAASTH